MLTATCNNCGSPKEIANYGDIECPNCKTTRKEAEQHFAAENPKASESDILYAGRMAVLHRAHKAHKNFVDPRSFSGANGMIPLPPSTNRGSTE